MMNLEYPSPLHDVPRPREPAFAFLSRLAAAGGVSAVDFGQDVELPFAEIAKGIPDALRQLERLSGNEEGRLAAWTPLACEGHRRSINGHRFPVRPLLTSEVRGCPVCLREDIAASSLEPHRAMTFQAHRLIHHVSLCVRHQTSLVPLWKDTAPSLRYDTAQRFREIADEIASGAMDGDARAPTEFEVWFDRRLAGEPHNETWLDEHPLHAASVFCRLLGYALLRLHDLKPRDVAPKWEHLTYDAGFAVAYKGEAEIIAHLQQLNALAEPRIGPKAAFPVLYDRLSREHRDDPDFKPYRDVLARHLLDSWPMGPGDDLLGEPVEFRRLHSVRTASEETGIDMRRLRKMLEAANLIDPNMPDNWATFDAQAAQKLLAPMVSFVSAKQFSEMHGINRSQFDLLVEDGILTPALPNAKSKNVWDPRDGRAFLDGLLSGAEIIQQAQHGWETISKAAQRLKIRPAAIIHAIRRGRIQRVARNVQFHGYGSVHVYHEEVAQVLGADEPAALSLELFAKSVGLAQPVFLNRLVRDSHVPSTEMRNPRTKAMQRYITGKDAAVFHARFVTLRTLAKARGVAWQKLAAKLRDAGVLPFSPEGVDYGYLYLRSEVERILGS
ncbi:TniQ family protein [Sagittula sp. NFXS13]|uniref:TniQ family protein n=1 Tax=Sagittula sp. NFXS13 TaxID=2819095 RepID=UPI0032DF806C